MLAPMSAMVEDLQLKEFDSLTEDTVTASSPRFARTYGTAKYVPPIGKSSVGSPSVTGKESFSSALEDPSLDLVNSLTRTSFKTERWRERGEERWPHLAAKQMKKQPRQFVKAEEVIPVQRMLENPQNNIHAELWCRSLRTKKLDVNEIGKFNTSIASVNTSIMFDHRGIGWSGKTNTTGVKTPRPGTTGPHVKDWIERPVAVGRYGLKHMNGSRYAMDLSPRNCVPNSMERNLPRIAVDARYNGPMPRRSAESPADRRPNTVR